MRKIARTQNEGNPCILPMQFTAGEISRFGMVNAGALFLIAVGLVRCPQGRAAR